MRIVTLNTWKNDGDYPRRLALMAEGLAALEADAICLQECFAGAGDDTAAFLAQALSMVATVRPARSKPREHFGRQVPSTSGLAILSRRPPLAYAALELTSDPRDGERVALRADLAEGGLRVANLHLTHLRGAAELRGRQLAEALAWARAGWDGALMLCGDLNCNREAPEFAPLLPAAGGELGSTLQAQRLSGNGSGGAAIDHGVLVEAGCLSVQRRFLALTTADAGGCLPSDHAAVVVDLAARGPTS